MRIIVATGNEGKMKEIRALLSELPVEIYSLKDLNLHPDIVENGTSLRENALIKARSLGVLPDTIVLGDDSGFSIAALQGEPGIYSARFLNSFPTREEAFQNILGRMDGLEGDDRRAQFETDIALLFPDGSEEVCVGILSGEVSEKIVGENGFGYDPIFYYPPEERTTAELLPAEKNAISHRSRALKKAKAKIEAYLQR